MLERVSEHGEVCPLTIRVTVSSLKSDPSRAEDVHAKRLMTFYEDCFLSLSSGGTEITKVWCDLEKHTHWFIPFGLLISMAVKQDAPRLETAWNGPGGA